jgi:F-type H+-transporting ATPase subunit alpha
VHEPLQTGIKAIDAMIPIGRGQRELIIGDRKTGKTAIAIDAIINQKQYWGTEDAWSASTSRWARRNRPWRASSRRSGRTARWTTRSSSTRGARPRPDAVHRALLGLRDGRALHVETARKDADGKTLATATPRPEARPAACTTTCPSRRSRTASSRCCCVARRAARRSRATCSTCHSRLLERSDEALDENGAGSLTALPVIETQEGDVSAYIPTNVISITDGQIYLEPDLFYAGVRPAINVGYLGLPRGRCRPDKAMKKIAGSLRLDLAAFRELEAFAQLGTDLDKGDAGRSSTAVPHGRAAQAGHGGAIPARARLREVPAVRAA